MRSTVSSNDGSLVSVQIFAGDDLVDGRAGLEVGAFGRFRMACRS